MKRNGLRRVGEANDVNDVMSRNLRIIRLHVDYTRRTGATKDTCYHRSENLRRLAERLPCPLLDATPEDLDDWQSSLNISNSSIATYTSHAHAFYRWAVEAGHIDVDPSVRLPRPRVPDGLPRPIPRADLEIALECAPEPMRTWLVLGAYMGLRAAEIAQIRREDITEGIIDGRRRHFLSGVGKGNKPFRLPIPAEVLPVLQPHLTGRTGPLWRTSLGTPARSSYVTNCTRRFFLSLDMPYTMHRCRHTYGTEVHKMTKDLLVTQRLMRHSNPATTTIYVEPVESAGVAALDQLSARIRRNNGGASSTRGSVAS